MRCLSVRTVRFILDALGRLLDPHCARVIDGKGGAVFESKLGGLCKGQFRWSDGQNTRSRSSPTECTSSKESRRPPCFDLSNMPGTHAKRPGAGPGLASCLERQG